MKREENEEKWRRRERSEEEEMRYKMRTERSE
jgi:hypothetical protein